VQHAHHIGQIQLALCVLGLETAQGRVQQAATEAVNRGVDLPDLALSLGGVAMRPVVLSDADGDSIAIRTNAVVGLAYDTRVVDATTATAFLVRLAEVLAERDWAAEL
jgi:hypothetical protein